MATKDEIFEEVAQRVTVGKAAYEKLAGRICSGVVYPSYLPVLAIQLTPQEAELIVDLADGVTPAQLTKSLNVDENTLTKQIDGLIAKRVILRGATGGYAIPQTPRFFPHSSSPEANSLFTTHFRDGSYQQILVAGWKRRMAAGSPQSHKVIPAHQALRASKNLRADDILWYEDIEQIYRRAAKVTQGGWKPDGTLGSKKEGGCGCRRVWDDACDSPGGCTGWEWKPGEWGKDETLRAQQTAAMGGPGMQRPALTVEQAMKAVYEMEDYGLVKISPNTAQITGTCNCCPDCCVIIQPMKNYGDIYKMLAPSRFKTVISEETCNGCQTCVDRCHFDAIEMRKVPNSKKMKAFVIDEHCMGCGLCIFKCKQTAMHLELVRPPEYIPTTPWRSPSTYEGQQARAAVTASPVASEQHSHRQM